MPTYEFACSECGERFDVRATIREREASSGFACPKCGSPRTEQILTAPMILRRGAGAPFAGCDPGAGCCG